MTENSKTDGRHTTTPRDRCTRHLSAASVRSTVWRTRLDTTTNWAIVTTGIALRDVQLRPGGALADRPLSFLLAAFLLFEARRYQYLDIWNTRLHVMKIMFLRPDPARRGDLHRWRLERRAGR